MFLAVVQQVTPFQKLSLKYVLDLSNASLISVVLLFLTFRLKRNANYTCGGLLFNLHKVEDAYDITLEPILVTDDFYMDFTVFLLEQDLNLSTIKLYLSLLKAALNWGLRHKCPVSETYDIFDVEDFSILKFAFTQDELSHIYHFDLSKIKRRDKRETMQRVKDAIVLFSNLGLRYSDASRINPSMFKNNKTRLELIQLKTGNKSVVDLMSMTLDKKLVFDILNKYNYNAPVSYDISLFNKRMKELLLLIGEEFNEVIPIQYKCHGKMITKELHKWKIFSSHSCRRTFVTLNIARGKTDQEIRKCTGHKTAEAFLKYIIDTD